ncbi:MAG TPA: SOS response-associated peptidase [Chloroflexota bacterium]
MCGRFTLANTGQLSLRFGLAESAEAEGAAPAPRYNIAPGQDVATVVERAGQRSLRAMRWGFAPAWLKDAKGPAPINARAETLLERPLFRGALAQHRCLIPADGFYEWQAHPGRKTKQPIYARLRDGSLFAFAGLYTPAGGDRAATCVIITTAPNELMVPVHNRMPAILDPDNEAAWLDPDLTEPHAVLGMLHPYQADRMEAYPVAPLVSSVRNDGPALITPLG